jgi:hypothetical protein
VGTGKRLFVLPTIGYRNGGQRKAVAHTTEISLTLRHKKTRQVSFRLGGFEWVHSQNMTPIKASHHAALGKSYASSLAA